ncbi:MAG: M60 family metallopeptidase [Fermentimonas sp.]|nr:M60 family metallopeptidase [Fermentimonas sp.]
MNTPLRAVRLIVLFIFTCCFVFSCSDKTDDTPPFLTIKPDKVNLTADASEAVINISTNALSWDASVSPSSAGWITIQKSKNSIGVSVSENSDDDSRAGEITVKAGDLTEVVEVVQMGQTPTILVSSNIFTVSADGDVFTLEITSNIEYEIVIPEEADSWIKLSESLRASGMVKNEFEFDVSWNTTETERKAEVIIRQVNGSVSEKIIVVQKAQEGYSGGSADDILDDIKVPVSSATASSYQPGGEIEKSFDGDYSTLYHSNWNNSAENYFPITLDYNFSEQESIDYLIYHPRTSGGNGNFKKIEIWVSTKSNPSFVKIMDFDFMGSGSATKIVFDEPLTDPKSVRFIVKSGAGDGQGFASCAEMEFYRFNTENFNPLSVFTDFTCSELNPGITMKDIESISSKLYRNIALYLYNGTYPDEFRIQEFRAWPHPDAWSRENKTSTLSLLDNPTGISVSKDEDLVVFVGETGGYSISLKIQNLDLPGGDGYNNASFYPLSPGVNKLKARNGGLVYLFYHTPDYQSAPKIKMHFATGKVNGYYDSQKHQPVDWKRLVNQAVDKYFDVLGEYAHLTFPTQDFIKYASSNGPGLIDAYDDLVRLESEFMGLMKYNRPTVNRAYFHVMYHSYMYATSYRTAYNASTTGAILNLNSLKSEPWGPAHEMGHTFQTRPGFLWRGMTEVTNNVHSLYVQTQWGNESRIETESMGRFNNRYEKAYFSSFVQNTPHPGEEDVFCKLVSLWQLQLYFSDVLGETDVYKDLYEKVRTSPNKATAGEQQLEFVKMMCDVTQTDLTDFFGKWGYLSPYDKIIDDYGEGRFTITQNQIDKTTDEIKAKNYPLPTGKLEYICDSNVDVFKNRQQVKKGTVTVNSTTFTMKGWENVAAFEVYQNEKLVFASNKSTFKIDQSVDDKIKVYALSFDGNRTEVVF